MSDEEFLTVLPDALHFACFICFVKELKTEHVLSDTGILHELVHLICDQRLNAEGTSLSEVRALFAKELALV